MGQNDPNLWKHFLHIWLKNHTCFYLIMFWKIQWLVLTFHNSKTILDNYVFIPDIFKLVGFKLTSFNGLFFLLQFPVQCLMFLLHLLKFSITLSALSCQHFLPKPALSYIWTFSNQTIFNALKCKFDIEIRINSLSSVLLIFQKKNFYVTVVIPTSVSGEGIFPSWSNLWSIL